MAKWQTSVKKWVARIAPNAIWKGIEWIGGSSVMTSIGRFFWLEYHRSPVDWWWLACLMGAGLFLVAIGLSREYKKADAVPASSPLPSAPIWEGHESEEAWRASITEQNRLITLAHSVDGLLNPAQIEMLWLYKGLCDIFAAEPLPERRDEPDSEARFVTAMNYRDSRILTRYSVEMKGKVLPFYQKLHLERSIHGAFVAMAEKPRRVEDIKSLTTQLLHFALADEGVQ